MTDQIVVAESERASSLSLITSEGQMGRVMQMAKMMAGSKVTVPKHLQGSEGDCAAIVIQAANWGMNPFAVAQKTHLVNGVLGYEAQLVNAVIQSSNAIKGTFKYEYKGEGNSLQCRVGAVLNGEDKVTWGEFLSISDITTKNSPLWKTNPKQQIGYLQVKNWARLYCPGAILGVYTADELEEIPAPERDITPAAAAAPDFYSDDEFKANEQAWRKVIDNGKEPERFIAFIEANGKSFTEAQKKAIATWKKAPATIDGEATQVDDDFVNELSDNEVTA